MVRGYRSVLAVLVTTLVCLVGGTSAQQLDDAARPAPAPAQVAPHTPQDFSWYPFEQRPPFVSDFVEDEDVDSLIHAGSALFTTDDPPIVPAALTKALRDGAGQFVPGYFLVHFAAPVDQRAKDLLDALTGPVRRQDGSALVRWYVPNQTLVAWIGTEATYLALSEADPVDWVGRYEPAYKLDPTIGTVPLSSAERVGRLSYVLDVDLVPGHGAADVAAQVVRLGARVLETVALRGENGYDVSFLVVEALPGQVTALAGIEGVRTLQERGDGLATYDLSGGGKLQNRLLAADDGSASPIVTAATFPLWLLHDLQGQGQLIGVVDTALDWNNVGTTGCGFGFPDLLIQNWGFALPNLSRVLLPSVGTGGVNLKIPRADVLGGAALQSTVTSEHGTAAAGAALGDFYGNNDTKWWEHDVDSWESWTPSNFSGLLGDGIAHEAQLFFTPVMNGSTFRWELVGEFETNMNTTLDNMAAAGVSTTNHSVGLAESANTYTPTSVVHDTNGYDHPEMLQCMAAGNAGAGANKLTSQAVVKNALAVGASDDVLKPEDRVSFSSTGPRFDGARKPDVMATGDDTAPRTGGTASLLILPDSNGTSAASCQYQWTSGTSFSSPTMAGAGALVHQYFQEGRYLGSVPLGDASAALIKSMLVNAGHRLTGANLDGIYPSMYQGWGEPNLSDVLDFGAGSRQLIVADVPRASGFTSSASTPHSKTFNVTGSGQSLRVSLAWTDEPGSTGTAKKLINDLDLLVTAPGGTLYRGNVFNTTAGTSITGGAADTLNNVECVVLTGPAVGAWSATIDPGAGNYAAGQGYALVVTGAVSESGGGPAAPVAEFSGSPLSGVAPLLVSFTSLASGTIDTHAWTFGDGGTSNAASPSHTYTSPGTYTVAYTVTGPGGSDTETKTNYLTVSPPPSGGGLYYLSFGTAATIPGVGSVADEDVVTYDVSSGTWALYFDGSDVGLGSTDIDALHVLADGDLLLSFDSATFSVPGLTGGPSGTTVADSDLVIFNVVTSGATTIGTFSFIFDGSDVGLTTSNEDIDGVYEFPGGGLGLSFLGGASVPGLSSIQDEDIVFFAATQYGSVTAGTWSMHFDGSDVGFSTSADEDIAALAFENGVDLLFSTVGNWSAAGGAGANEDVGRFSGTFGATTSGTASLELDLSAIGIDASEEIDGLHFTP